MIYAGIGSRDTPEKVLAFMYKLGREWGHFDFTLRSGGAKGADTAFEYGALESGGPLEIFYANKYRIGYADIYHDPNSTSNIYEYDSEIFLQALGMAEAFHPNWGACSPWARKLLARNCFIILGESLNEPVDLVVCWTEGGKLTGGTAQALRIAHDRKIPVENLGEERYASSL